jgi:hypothetical protein
MTHSPYANCRCMQTRIWSLNLTMNDFESLEEEAAPMMDMLGFHRNLATGSVVLHGADANLHQTLRRCCTKDIAKWVEQTIGTLQNI